MPELTEKTKYPGIYRRHGRTCKGSSRANCGCPYQATVWSSKENKLLKRQALTLSEARQWREDAASAIRAGRLQAPSDATFQEKADELIQGMSDGSIYDRSGKPYKPSSRRSYERGLRLHLLPRLGKATRLSTIERRDVQAAVEAMHRDGLSASTIKNVLNPLQVICRRAVHRGELMLDPTDGLELPAVRGRRDRIATPEQAQALIDALPPSERAFWATALYAGLRRGELRALRCSSLDLGRKLLRVERAWDDDEGEIEVKTDAGRRVVPVAGPLRSALEAHLRATGRSGDDLVFGRTATAPFVPTTIRSRARRAWKAAGLEPLTPHEARHCAASYLIAAGLNAKELSTYIGHSDIRVTYNRYGHLMPGNEEAAADRLTAFFAAQPDERVVLVESAA